MKMLKALEICRDKCPGCSKDTLAAQLCVETDHKEHVLTTNAWEGPKRELNLSGDLLGAWVEESKRWRVQCTNLNCGLVMLNGQNTRSDSLL